MSAETPRYSKTYCRSIESYGYKFGGYSDGLYFFHSRVPMTLDRVIYNVFVTEEDITNGDFAHMFKNNLTRDRV